jgi:NADH-quinone oxidoreductase subunit C
MTTPDKPETPAIPANEHAVEVMETTEAAVPLGQPTTGQTEVVARGMFGITGSGDTSGFGGLVRRARPQISTPQPWGGWFDEAYAEIVRVFPEMTDAVEVITSHRGELTMQVDRSSLLGLLKVLRDEPALRFELLSSVSGVDYPDDVTGRQLHAVYHLLSMTWNRRLRIEVAMSYDDAHLPSAVSVYPTADWHEREAWDMFGIVFDGHPGLTRILMPDDWDGHPQLKSYPLGGIQVEYVGASVPPPDQRRSYA